MATQRISENPPSTETCYVGKCTCGLIHSLSVIDNNEHHDRRLAELTAEWNDEGLELMKMPKERAKSLLSIRCFNDTAKKVAA